MGLFDEKGKLEKQLEEHQTAQIPSELSWERMSPGILAGVKKKRRRRIIFWWFFFGCFFLLSGGGLYLLLSQAKLNESSHEIKKISVAPETSGSVVQEGRSVIMSSPLDEGAVLPPQDRVPVSAMTNPLPKLRLLSTSGLPEELSSTTATKQLLPIYSSLSKPANPSDSSARNIVSLPTFRNTVVDPISTLENKLEYSRNDSLEVLEHPIKPLPYPKWQLLLWGGINTFSASYNPQEAGSSTPGDYETPLTGWQAGLRLKRKLSSAVHLSSGIQFQQLRYRSNFFQTSAVNFYQPNTIDTIFISSFTGEETYVYRDSVPGTRTRNFQHYNQHTLLSIPLLLGYEWRNNRWQIGFQTGVNLQAYQESVGRSLAVPNQIFDLSKNFYKKGIRYSYLLEAQISYQISHRTSLIVQFGWEQALTNWLEPNVNIIQRPTIINGGVGIGWRF